MGNRQKGRVKKKSIKVPIHSKMGSKRKLSRMGKKRKKNLAGLNATFIGRAQCLKRLQVTLKDFRRLCILKGIYPREPIKAPKKKKGQTFYHIKDIRSIAHEPVLEKFREFRAFMKKIRRAAGRNERDEAARKNAVVPTYTLHHLVKERYPRFVDALSDLDDALTLTYLFAALPSEGKIKAKVTNQAKFLSAAWGAYCATCGAIQKSFISVRGVYLEAQIHNTAVRWIVPHSFTQNLPEDVDYAVMQTFFEFYETLLKFILFKLYSDMGVRFPLPVTDVASAAKGSKTALLAANLQALQAALTSSSGAITDAVRDSVDKTNQDKETTKEKNDNNDEKGQQKVSKEKSKELVKTVGDVLNKIGNEENDDDDDKNKDGEEEEDDDNVDIAGPLKAALETMADEENKTTIPVAGGDSSEVDGDALKRKGLFAGLTFFLSREVPRGYLDLVCLAYGGKVGWEGDDSLIDAKDPSITHHIVDRPKLPLSYDTLPKSREYCQPQWVLDCANFMFILPISKYAVGAALPPHLSPWVDDDEEGYKPAYAEEIERLKNGEEEPMEDDEDEEEEAAKVSDESEAEEEHESETEETKEAKKEEEEDKEKEDKPKKKDKKDEAARKRSRKQKEEDETHELAKVMMSKKAAKLYGKMQHGIAAKKAKVDLLQKRREEFEEQAKKKEQDEKEEANNKATTGALTSKEKVERLKKERKNIEESYSNTGGSMKKKQKQKQPKKNKKSKK